MPYKFSRCFYLQTPDVARARDELTAAGYQVVRWEGKGKTCYLKDPFGFTFNLWEEA